jgi:hypothetical protein
MRLTWVAPNRNATLGLVFLFVFVLGSVGVVIAQNPPAQQTPPAAQQQTQQAPQPVTFPGDAAIVVHYIKADKAADFEAAMAKLKEALQKSQSPERKQQAAGWKVLKSPDPAGEGQVAYLWIIDPVVKGADYSVSKIVSEVFPSEALAIYTSYAGSYAKGQVKLNGNLVSAMGQ